MANTEIKVTKAMVLEAVKALVIGEEIETAVTNEDIVAYCDTTLAQLAAKADKAKDKAAEKRAEGDALRAKVEAVLTNEFQNADEITAKVDEADITRQKVIARLTALVNAGVAEKDVVKVEKTKKTVYRLKAIATAENADADADVEDAE